MTTAFVMEVSWTVEGDGYDATAVELKKSVVATAFVIKQVGQSRRMGVMPRP